MIPPPASAWSRRRVLRTVFCSSAMLGLNVHGSASAADVAGDQHWLMIGDFGSQDSAQSAVAGGMKTYAQGHGSKLSGLLLLGDNASAARRQESLTVLHREARQLSRLVDDLFLLSTTESGGLPLTIREVDVAAVLEEVAASFRPLARREGHIAMVTKLEPDLPLALGDRERIVQVLGNLVRNALRYTPDGGLVSLQARRQFRVVKVEALADAAQLGRGEVLAREDQAVGGEAIHQHASVPVENPPARREDGDGFDPVLPRAFCVEFRVAHLEFPEAEQEQYERSRHSVLEEVHAACGEARVVPRQTPGRRVLPLALRLGGNQWCG